MDNIPTIKSLLESESFRIRTAMYIGEKKISILKAFLDGVFYAINAYQVRDQFAFGDFHDWVAKYYGWEGSTAGWSRIILAECDEDEEKAVDVFFDLYDEYKEEIYF